MTKQQDYCLQAELAQEAGSPFPAVLPPPLKLLLPATQPNIRFMFYVLDFMFYVLIAMWTLGSTCNITS